MQAWNRPHVMFSVSNLGVFAFTATFYADGAVTIFKPQISASHRRVSLKELRVLFHEAREVHFFRLPPEIRTSTRNVDLLAERVQVRGSHGLKTVTEAPYARNAAFDFMHAELMYAAGIHF